jgi:arsenate reductase (thioredoxin)
VPALSPATAAHVEKQIDDLAAEFEGMVSRETVARLVNEAVEGLSGARFANFLPILVYRFSRERLTALAHSEGTLTKTVPEVLFVCVHNAGRSQIAAALLNERGKGRVHVRSAGSAPGESLNPAVVEAMTEIGLDITQEYPKPLTDEFVRDADVVITMGCGDACPIYPGKRYEDWQLDDPAGQPVAGVRRIRDEVDARVQALLAELS